MSRILRIHENGGPEVLCIEDITDVPPATTEISIRVKAFGLNRSEAMFRANRHIKSPNFPARLRYEAAGDISAIGDAVEGFAIGNALLNSEMKSK